MKWSSALMKIARSTPMAQPSLISYNHMCATVYRMPQILSSIETNWQSFFSAFFLLVFSSFFYFRISFKMNNTTALLLVLFLVSGATAGPVTVGMCYSACNAGFGKSTVCVCVCVYYNFSFFLSLSSHLYVCLGLDCSRNRSCRMVCLLDKRVWR